MRKSASPVRPQVEVMESRALLSALAPDSTVHAGNTLAADVGSNMTRRVARVFVDSVKIRNQTPLVLEVTAVRKLFPSRRLTEVIPIERPRQEPSIKVFDFESNTNSPILIDVKAKDNPRTPPPLKNYSLIQPMDGYRGKLFSITLVGPYFAVSS